METTFTSAAANKYLRKLEDEKYHLTCQENETCTYVLAIDEEPCPPDYDYAATTQRITEIDAEVLKLRHALHQFNARTMLPNSDMTIDEALVAMAQLSVMARRLQVLRSYQPRSRVDGAYRSSRNIVEYRYANYDIASAEADYQRVTEQIADLQLKLDLVNQTETFTVDL